MAYELYWSAGQLETSPGAGTFIGAGNSGQLEVKYLGAGNLTTKELDFKIVKYLTK